MFDFLKNKKEDAAPEWLSQLNDAQQRWFAFLEKLEVKMGELGTAAIPELKEMLRSDDDNSERNFYKIQSGILCQFENIRKKAYDTYEEKVNNLYYELTSQTSALSDHYKLLQHFRTACSNRYHQQFEERYQYWCNQMEEASKKDLELEYRNILAAYETTKNKFSCKQCGSPILIEKIFFISVYIACPACSTQNNYEPGTQARSLQHIARDLAEQRTENLSQLYKNETERERELYHEIHQLKLGLSHEKNKTTLSQKQQQVALLEQQRQQAIANAPQLYRQYRRAMYNEWSKIIPDLKEHHEVMYQNEINSN